MTLRDLINKLLGRQTASANTARERLQLVLAHDRVDMSSLTTDLLEKMRKEILDVVAKYVEIDFEEVAVSLETEDRMTALVANLYSSLSDFFSVAPPLWVFSTSDVLMLLASPSIESVTFFDASFDVIWVSFKS